MALAAQEVTVGEVVPPRLLEVAGAALLEMVREVVPHAAKGQKRSRPRVSEASNPSHFVETARVVNGQNGSVKAPSGQGVRPCC